MRQLLFALTCAMTIIGTASIGFTQTQTPDYDGRQTKGEFGSAIAMDGPLLAVGQPGINGGKGGVQVFENNGTGWTLVGNGSLTPNAANDTDSWRCGESVDISGNLLVVGCPGKGRVLVYKRKPAGDGWNRIQHWETADKSQGLGKLVSISGNHVLFSDGKALYSSQSVPHTNAGVPITANNTNIVTNRVIQSIDNHGDVAIIGTYSDNGIVVSTHANFLKFNQQGFIWQDKQQVDGALNSTIRTVIGVDSFAYATSEGVYIVNYVNDTLTPPIRLTQVDNITEFQMTLFENKLLIANQGILDVYAKHHKQWTRFYQETTNSNIIATNNKEYAYGAPKTSVTSPDGLLEQGEVYISPIFKAAKLDTPQYDPNGVVFGLAHNQVRFKLGPANGGGGLVDIRGEYSFPDGIWRLPLNEGLTPLPPGEYILRAEDPANNQTISETTFRIVSMPSDQLNFELPHNSSIEENATINGACVGNNSKVKIAIKKDLDPTWAYITTTCMNNRWTYQGAFTKGTYRFIIEQPGNLANAQSIKLNVARKPVIKFDAPMPLNQGMNWTVFENIVTFSGTCTNCERMFILFNENEDGVTLIGDPAGASEFSFQIEKEDANEAQLTIEAISDEGITTILNFTILFENTQTLQPPEIVSPDEHQYFDQNLEFLFNLDLNAQHNAELVCIIDNETETFNSGLSVDIPQEGGGTGTNEGGQGDVDEPIGAFNASWRPLENSDDIAGLCTLTVESDNGNEFKTDVIVFTMAIETPVEINDESPAFNTFVEINEKDLTLTGISSFVDTTDVFLYIEDLSGQPTSDDLIVTTVPISSDGNWRIELEHNLKDGDYLFKIEVETNEGYLVEYADITVKIKNETAMCENKPCACDPKVDMCEEPPFRPAQINTDLCSSAPSGKQPGHPIILVIMTILGYAFSRKRKLPLV